MFISSEDDFHHLAQNFNQPNILSDFDTYTEHHYGIGCQSFQKLNKNSHIRLGIDCNFYGMTITDINHYSTELLSYLINTSHVTLVDVRTVKNKLSYETIRNRNDH